MGETERIAKRDLISKNRKRRHLEKVYESLIKETNMAEEDCLARSVTIAKNYCKIIDTPQKLPAERLLMADNKKRMEIIKETLKEPIIKFAQTFPIYETLDETTLQQLFDGSLWIKINVLLIIHRYDPSEQCLCLPSGCVFKEDHKDFMNDEQYDIICRFLRLAHVFNKIELDNIRLALLTALFTFYPYDIKPPKTEIRKLFSQIRKDIECLHELYTEGPTLTVRSELYGAIAELQINMPYFKKFFNEPSQFYFIVNLLFDI
ncbi:unnamed protein product [Dracunculus medinensis]|uniref:NR LBD domain-containing protein n=1 Tax=Dracunculus medinensis TaxID=318479 RepID=A0A0N4UAJ6_DRAME|nr:unnamed protein product [Dracunculus medinensis]